MLHRMFYEEVRDPFACLCSRVQTEAGRIGLEGCLCEDYYKIRELLYQQYAVV